MAAYLAPPCAPGPGKYEVRGSFGKSGPRFSMQTRAAFRRKARDEVPGPGAYSHQHPHHVWGRAGPKPSFKGRYRYKDSDARDMPGPGAYDATAAFKRREKTIAFSFAGKNIVPNHQDETPGPIYDVVAADARRRAKGPKYSFSGKYSYKDLDVTPGPGQYSQDHPNASFGRAGIKFSLQGKRHYKEEEERAPGPGKYTIPQIKPMGPKYTMRARFHGDYTYANSTNAHSILLRDERPAKGDRRRFKEAYSTTLRPNLVHEAPRAQAPPVTYTIRARGPSP